MHFHTSTCVLMTSSTQSLVLLFASDKKVSIISNHTEYMFLILLSTLFQKNLHITLKSCVLSQDS